jgi:hypothetical protein
MSIRIYFHYMLLIRTEFPLEKVDLKKKRPSLLYIKAVYSYVYVGRTMRRPLMG